MGDKISIAAVVPVPLRAAKEARLEDSAMMAELAALIAPLIAHVRPPVDRAPVQQEGDAQWR